MKGYVVAEGYMGYIPSENRYRLFSTEEEYVEYFKEMEEVTLWN